MYQLQKKYRYDIHKAYIIDQNQFFLSELSLNGVMWGAMRLKEGGEE
jgi:hypothetical protein